MTLPYLKLSIKESIVDFKEFTFKGLITNFASKQTINKTNEAKPTVNKLPALKNIKELFYPKLTNFVSVIK